MIRLAVRAPAEAGEAVLAALLELAPAGVEQVDGDGWVEYAIYGPPGELPALPEGPAELGGVRVAVSGRRVPEDWAERWKRFHRPVVVGGRVRVRPPFAPAAGDGEAQRAPGAGEGSPPGHREPPLDIAIDPGRAFGTGSHPTTRLCLELLLEVAGSRGSLADLGCGSGVLSIAAALLGFAPVTAVDHEPAAIEATLANARANGVTLDRVERRNLREEAPPTAATVAANLVRPLLLRVARLMEGRPRALIASGLLDREADEAAAAFAPLRERRRLSSGGWTALLLTR